VTLVHNGIDTSQFAPVDAEHRQAVRRMLGVPELAPLLVTTSVLRDHRKGVHVLLQAMRQILATHPGARLLVIGDGPIRVELEADAGRLGIAGAVHWAGHRRDVSTLLGAGDVFVMPTFDDPFPTAVLEAMAVALPIVASEIGGIPEMLPMPGLGYLVPPGDAPALARAVCALLGDADARQTAGRAARRHVCSQFSTGVWVERLARVYATALGRTNAVPGHVGTGRVAAS